MWIEGARRRPAMDREQFIAIELESLPNIVRGYIVREEWGELLELLESVDELFDQYERERGALYHRLTRVLCGAQRYRKRISELKGAKQ
jgi:hypothetical protein